MLAGDSREAHGEIRRTGSPVVACVEVRRVLRGGGHDEQKRSLRTGGRRGQPAWSGGVFHRAKAEAGVSPGETDHRTAV